MRVPQIFSPEIKARRLFAMARECMIRGEDMIVVGMQDYVFIASLTMTFYPNCTLAGVRVEVRT